MRQLRAALDTLQSTIVDSAMFPPKVYEAIATLDGFLDYINFDTAGEAQHLKKHIEESTLGE